ncbi:MAG: Holliday junction resolvase RuvX [Veillonellaceae bacterium]|nr:Holliday junction resolvase RuvX [Veillonellaceae bacterium]
MRIMSLDVGSRTIGIACSDALYMTAQGIETIRRTSLVKDFQRIQELIDQYEVEELVVGMPKNMNGTKGDRAEKTEAFVAKMKEVITTPVTYWDERLTTVMAERSLIAADVSRKKRKQVIDKMAAVVILQGYLDHRAMHKTSL